MIGRADWGSKVLGSILIGVKEIKYLDINKKTKTIYG